MFTKAFFFKTNYSVLAEGEFALPVDSLTSLVNSRIFICITEDNLRFALTNITVQPIRNGFLRVGFEPKTDVNAITTPIITPKTMWSEYDFDACSVENIPSFNISTHEDKNNEQLIALSYDLRMALMHYREGMYCVTDIVLRLHEHGIFVVDIDQNLKVALSPIAVLSERPTHAVSLSKDNGVLSRIDDFELPDLAKLIVLL
ncbi:hypothetical protein pEaSNUABM34_00258 [Erwinia phage pEa_SNUABM_34]|nr:hypothetical protein pEaSNUABM34_00258 [Erwinia phage pEa_SNUABM_34]QYW03901.1 hypothetical protein pEaSNUABM45_00258 [Erwinia phage pEa_SNUABM_45]QYW04242.1 hypothetical protein pEaSNUABM46_00258 [Erwinia phage pEa_SNUABM_46]